ncbi:hypothetical protein LPJ66_000254 [Kickxella alabastrina]|uniref:Uncharacterized protein n=1 Tax=Kickxella alabastrina TaxID=61397 RepID=A0ACC1IWW6_9FUNG|nr:hypothetical protein LPJ66_000254 [Kickxella alabastrina]
MSFEILNDADIYFGYGLKGFDGTISPVSTLLNAVSGIGDDECLRQASINAGIGAGVLKPDGPAATRIVRKSTERGSRQGLCNVCNSWVDIDSSRKVQINVPEIYWWKHIQACIKRTWKAE